MVHYVIAVGHFAGAVATASYVPKWRELADANPAFETLPAIVRSSVTLAVSSCC